MHPVKLVCIFHTKKDQSDKHRAEREVLILKIRIQEASHFSSQPVLVFSIEMHEKTTLNSLEFN